MKLICNDNCIQLNVRSTIELGKQKHIFDAYNILNKNFAQGH